ncbi:MAG TPA: hypothetical protein PKK06_12265 [Phycisphaerae bacterium]|nr:hypothetical protein [Phycisphaerae bacterium]HNU46385.1 hypothetical protein [Phycisphaerae bacterium]
MNIQMVRALATQFAGQPTPGVTCGIVPGAARLLNWLCGCDESGWASLAP